ncbi:FAD synthase-like isoform X2 [Cimex lectularius]|nr:FAD synthase-like isoform X2 [Cimex lectularius]
MSPPKTAGVIIIGDEVLKGQVEDKNLHFLAKKLTKLGIRLCKVSVIGDSVDEIAKEISEFSSKYDQVITTGGIGPTHDDVTYEGLAAAFNDVLIVNKEMADFWTWFNNDIDGQARKSTIKMATVPSNATIQYTNLKEHISPRKFPVVTMHNVCIFPGIPSYVKAIFEGLEGNYFMSTEKKFHIKRLYLNVWESVVTDSLNETVSKFPTISFGSYPKVNCPYYKVVITMESENGSVLDGALEFLRSRILDEYITDEGGMLGDAWINLEQALNDGKFNSFLEPLDRAIKVIESIFEENSPHEIFIAFNGGKDCTVLLHLVHTVLNRKYGLEEYPKINVLYVKNENTFKEVEDFICKTTQRYRLDLVTKQGPIRNALNELKMTEEGKRWKIALMGTRRNDPCGKNLDYIQKTDQGWSELTRVSPILDWSYSNIWQFLRTLSIPYCKLYDQGYTSLDGKNNSLKNPKLRYVDETGKECFHPAWKLDDESAERSGRE